MQNENEKQVRRSTPDGAARATKMFVDKYVERYGNGGASILADVDFVVSKGWKIGHDDFGKVFLYREDYGRFLHVRGMRFPNITTAASWLRREEARQARMDRQERAFRPIRCPRCDGDYLAGDSDDPDYEGERCCLNCGNAWE